MESKLNEIFSKIKNSDKRLKIFTAIGLAGILIILLSEAVPNSSEKKTQNSSSEASYTEYAAELENKTQSLVSSINGVGRCKVMITLKNTNESIYAKNSEENNSNGSYSKKYEYVLYDGQDGDEPVLVKQYFPQIQGVAVVCDGADSEIVRENVVSSISSLFDISASKISVSKYK